MGVMTRIYPNHRSTKAKAIWWFAQRHNAQSTPGKDRPRVVSNLFGRRASDGGMGDIRSPQEPLDGSVVRAYHALKKDQATRKATVHESANAGDAAG